MQVVVMASGTGSNFAAICQAQKQLGMQIKALVVDKVDIKAIEIAKEYEIPCQVVEYQKFASRSDFNQALANVLSELKPDLICLAGYMRILDEAIIARFRDQIINIHPSLLPKYPGLKAIEQAYFAGETTIGVTTHYVDEQVDTGQIIMQASFPITGLSLEEVYAKLKPVEHDLYIQTIRTILKHK